MRFSCVSALALAGNALALVTPYECLANNGNELATRAACGHQGTISECLVQLRSYEIEEIKACFVDGGCDPLQANTKAKAVLKHCEELGKAGDLRRRYQAMPIPSATLTSIVDKHIMARATDGPMSSTDCFTTIKKSTSDCPIITKDGKKSTDSCTPTEVMISKCHSSMICTKNSAEQDICMVKRGLETSGIVITVVFVTGLVIGFAGITYMCCRDRKEQKRLNAKAEAVALARAATKKQKSQQDRAPLMRGQSQTSGGGDPFQDQTRS